MIRRSARTLVGRALRALENQQTSGLQNTTTSVHVGAPFAMASRKFASDADLLKTPLYDFHVENGGAWLLVV
jgi:hypothetical protein